MRAAGLLPLLLPLLLLLLGVASQDDADSGQNTTTTNKETTGVATTASTAKTSSITSATPLTLAQMASASTTKEGAAVATTAQSTATTAPDRGKPSSSAATPPATAAGITPTASETASIHTTTTSPHTSGQGNSSHSAATPTASPAARSQQPSTATVGLGSLGTTTAAKSVPANVTSPPGAVVAAATSSPSTQPQGKQPLSDLPNTTVSSTVPRADSSQSSKECVVPPVSCATKKPPSSSSSPVQGPTPSTSAGSASASVTPSIGPPSLATTPTSQPRSKDTVPEAANTTAPGADRTTHGVGSASAKPTSASQSPASAWTSAPAAGNQTDSCSPGHQHPNISFPNELICEDQVQNTGPTIYLKEPRTCAEWRNTSNNISFFESFCSTAQHMFNTSRDTCTVMLTACEPLSHRWAVRVVLHLPLDSEEVFKGLKKEKLEELGIINTTSDKMVEDMTINDEFSTPLIITIITLAGSLLLIAAIYGCHQRFSQRKDQNIHPDVPGFDDGHVALIFNQRLTEEMQTMENGYHDNPTLEVMETSSEMQEKKVNLNGELGDSWIVPLDTLTKEELEEEEDTHL